MGFLFWVVITYNATMKLALKGYELEILLAILSEFSTESDYDYIFSKTNKAIENSPTRHNSEDYSQAITKLNYLGIISIDSPSNNLRPNLIRNKLCISGIYEDFHSPISTNKESMLHWRKLTPEQKHNYSAVFGSAMFRLIISNITLLAKKGFTLKESSAFLKNTLKPSILKALNLYSSKNREFLIETTDRSISDYTISVEDFKQCMYITENLPPTWAYDTPKPGNPQMETIFSLAQVLKLHQVKGLSDLTKLTNFSRFLRFVVEQSAINQNVPSNLI